MWFKSSSTLGSSRSTSQSSTRFSFSDVVGSMTEPINCLLQPRTSVLILHLNYDSTVIDL